MNNITQSLKVIVLAIVLSFGVSYVFAWAPPTAAPTGGNDSLAPLNTSNNDQTKNGNLFLNALGITNTASGALNVAGGGVFGGKVGIGTISPNALLTLQDGSILLKQDILTGSTGSNNIGLAYETTAGAGAAASMGIFKEASGGGSLVFKSWNGIDATVETARISSNGNLTTTGSVCDGTGACIGGATILEVGGVNNQTSWYCTGPVNLKDQCGDEDGCTIRLMMQHELDGQDQFRIIDEHIGMEQPTYSFNRGTGRYGWTRQSGGGDLSWISGDPAWKGQMFAPWDWAWMHNYKHEYCNGGVNGPAEPEYQFWFMSHPHVMTRIIITD